MSSTEYKTLGIIILLALVGVFAVSRSTMHKQNNVPANNNINFIHEGNLIRNNPGLPAAAWYLSYEESGKPGLQAQLKFGTDNTDLQSGERVRVEGIEKDGLVEVAKLEILNAYKSNLVWVDSPKPNQTVINPITLHGYAKSNWYFEATFPIKVLDANGKHLGQVAAQAQGNWMNEGYIEFMASLSFAKPSTASGVIVLEKDNPSGLPQNADELRIPITFGEEARAVKLYYYNSSKDKDSSGIIRCSQQGLVAVDRQIPITNTPIQDTIRLLMQGKLSESDKSQGISTEFPLAGVELKGASVTGQVLTLEFADPQAKTGGGSCRVAVLWAQIAATGKQFPGITDVKFKPLELFQP